MLPVGRRNSVWRYLQNRHETVVLQMLFHTFGCSCFVFSTCHWQFMVQRFSFSWSLLFYTNYTGRFILGQQPV